MCACLTGFPGRGRLASEGACEALGAGMQCLGFMAGTSFAGRMQRDQTRPAGLDPTPKRMNSAVSCEVWSCGVNGIMRRGAMPKQQQNKFTSAFLA